MKGVPTTHNRHRISPRIGGSAIVPDKSKHSRVEHLIGELNHHGERHPLKVVERIARFGKPAISPLVNALRTSANVRVRRWSAAALGKIGGKNVIGHLRKALRDPNMSVKLRALFALEDLKDPELGKQVMPLLEDPSGGVRVNAIDVIARMKFRGAAKHLIAATHDERWYIRQAAAQAIGVLRITAAERALEALIKDSRRAVRVAAKKSLQRLDRK